MGVVSKDLILCKTKMTNPKNLERSNPTSSTKLNLLEDRLRR